MKDIKEKNKLIDEGSELYEKIGQLKLKSLKDDKMYKTDTLDTTGIFRLINLLIITTKNLEL